MDRGVKEFFNSKTFTVVGTSRDSKNVGHIIFKNLLKANKRVFGINPKANKLLGQRIYNDLFEIPYKVDCVIIAVPAKFVPLVLRQAGKLKIKCAVIISSGFSETHNNQLEEQLFKIAEQENIKVLGPNTFGYLNTKENINTTFFSGEIKKGSTSFISQSGAIGSAVLDSIDSLNSFIGIGNSVQLDFSDFIEYFSKDKTTKVITLYMEGLKKQRGRKFIETCRKCKKPIIALKSGKSKSGQKAAASHTAALASNYHIYSGIFKQANIIETYSITEMFNIAKILEKHNITKKRALIITNAGGFGVLTTDYCEKNKIKIAVIPEKIKKNLDSFLPPTWSKNNPVDIIGDATENRYKKTLKLLDKENFFDFFIVLLTPQVMSEPLETAKILPTLTKPIFACFIGDKQTKEATDYLHKNGIINFNEPKKLCEALGKI